MSICAKRAFVPGAQPLARRLERIFSTVPAPNVAVDTTLTTQCRLKPTKVGEGWGRMRFLFAIELKNRTPNAKPLLDFFRSARRLVQEKPRVGPPPRRFHRPFSRQPSAGVFGAVLVQLGGEVHHTDTFRDTLCSCCAPHASPQSRKKTRHPGSPT